jgi:hypothetical protein
MVVARIGGKGARDVVIAQTWLLRLLGAPTDIAKVLGMTLQDPVRLAMAVAI